MADETPGRVAATLAAIRERARELTIDLSQEDHCGVVPCTGHDALRLLKGVEDALKHHRRIDRHPDLSPVCGCSRVTWPCPEVAAITAALTGEEADRA